MSEIRAALASTEASGLESALVGLRRFGKPWLFTTSDGNWRCKVEMHVAAAGASFAIQSEPMNTPSLAVQQCRQRIDETLKIYKEI